MGILKTKKKSLDLLTEEEESVKSSANKLLVFFIFAGIIVLELAIFGVFTILSLGDKNKLEELKAQVEAESQSRSNFITLAQDIKNVKNKLQNYDQNSSKYFVLSKKLEKLVSLVPTNLTLLSFNINNDGK